MEQNAIIDDEIVFADETPEEEGRPERCGWKLLIVDDEEMIHTATRIALDNFQFENRPLTLLSAYSGRAAREMLEAHPDIAVVLLDVVMESDDSGLELARHIRETLGNTLVQIVLRTGQPGTAPEKKVITRYDINDYREKTELTELRLFTTVTTALRAYRNLYNIDKSRKGLELIIASTGHLFADQRLRNFTEGVLTQFQSMLSLAEGSLFMQTSGFAASHEKNRLHILAATGEFSSFVNHPVETVPSGEIQEGIRESLRREQSLFTENAYIGYFRTENGSVNLLYLHGCRGLEQIEKELIMTFSSNVAIAYDRIFLTREIQDTQREVIEILGSVVETRSSETAYHVRRVAEFTSLLAQKAGLDEREAGLLKLASFMHDVGKIGVPDAILNKPGRLTAEEFEQIKTHTTLGHAILGSSRREIMETASIVALQHHERWDGRGYPRGLKGEEIHLYGRIVALADVFDALVNKRVYKEKMTLEEAADIIRKEKGGQFDPALAEIFLKDIAEFDILNRRWAE